VSFNLKLTVVIVEDLSNSNEALLPKQVAIGSWKSEL
jgi:hypothetical protein